MNIEEERKAFVELVYSKAGSLDFADGKFIVRQQSAWQAQAASHANHLFAAWLAAKAHAEEMAKPSQINVRICSDYHEEWFAFACSWQGPRFNSEDEAIKWAVDNGYKVIK